MSRLVDYFVVLAYDFERKDHGKIIQKFPLSDWADSKFIEGIELFCQPKGWNLTKISRNFDENVLTPTTGNIIKLNDNNAQSLQNDAQIKDEPTFFVSVLTDINGDRHYCACLTFRETYYELLSTKDAKTREDVYGKDKPFQPLPQQNSHDFEYFDLPTNNFFIIRNRIDKRVSTPNGSFNLTENNKYVKDELNRSYMNMGNCFANPLIGKEGLSSYNEAYDRTSLYQNHDGCSTLTPNHFTSSLSSYGLNGNNQNPSYSAPKCLVIISRHPFFDLFRKFLGKIYTTYLDHQNSPPDNMILESLIANLLSINVSLPLFQFSAEQLYNSFNESNVTSIPPNVPISLDEKNLRSIPNNLLHHKKDYLQVLSNQFPITDSCVATFFSQLGIHNSLMLVMACLMDHKILFHSKSYQRLTDSCHALTSLLFPLKYLNVYIPILPFTLLEILYAPTPFIIGLHADILEENNEMNDIITCDLDIGLVTIPSEMSIPIIPESIYQTIRTALEKIINPELEYADNAFQKLLCGLTPPNLLDKEIRSIFLHMYARLFKGYRSCLVLSRIIPKPYITFDKNKFLKYHGLVGNTFMNRLFESMAFQTFVNERGNPYRSYDIFDQIYHHHQTQNVILHFESTLAPYILNMETNLLNSLVLPDPISTRTMPKSNCIHGSKQTPYTQLAKECNILERRPFPYLNQTVVIEFLDIISKKNKCENSGRNLESNLMIENALTVLESTTCINKTSITSKLNKRSQTFCQCLENILKGDLHEAKKTFPSALRLLRSDLEMRTLFCEKLTQFSSAITTQQAENGTNICNKTILDSTQFDMIVQFINALLECENINDDNGLAASILPLSSIFCQKLATGVIQFIYTVIQNHLVWTNMSFWETSFYIDVQAQLLRHYQQTNPELTLKANGHILNLAANLLQNFSELPSDSVKDMIETEESIIYSMVIHYVNQIIYLRIPLELTDESSLLFYKTNKNEKISEINTNNYLMPNLSSCGKSHSYKNSMTDSKSPSVNRLSIKSSSIYSNNKRVFANAVYKPKIALTKMAKSVLHSTTLSRRHFSITSSKATPCEPFHNNINTTDAAYPTINNNNNHRLRNGSYIFDGNDDFSDSDNDMNENNDNGSLDDDEDGASCSTSNFDEESGFEDTAIIANNQAGINTENNNINHASILHEKSQIDPGKNYNHNETCALTRQNEVVKDAKGKGEQEIIMLEELIDSPMNQHVLQHIKDVEKFIHRFVDKVCGDLGVTARHMNNLYQMIPGLISMHVEMLENVRSQITSIPSSLLINHILPPLLPFETINKECKEGIRVYLFFGPMLTPYTMAKKHKNMGYLNHSYFPLKQESINSRIKTSPNNTHLILNQKILSHTQSSSPHTKQSNILIRNDDICQLVPAHGNLYVTNYRIIFRGVPIHEHAHESDILMSIPLWALSKATMIDIKRSSSSSFSKIFQYQTGKNSASINGGAQKCTTIFGNSNNTNDKNLNKFTTALVLKSLSFQIMHLVLDTNFVTNSISHYKCTQHICSYFNNVNNHRNLSKPYPLHVLQTRYNSTNVVNTAISIPTEANIAVETNKGYEKKKSHTFKMLKKTTSNFLHVSSALSKKANQSDLGTKDVAITNGQISFKSNKKSMHCYTEQDYICIRDFIRTKLISGVNEWNNIKINKMEILDAETSETEILSSYYTLLKCNQNKIPSYPPYFVIPSNLSESQDDIIKIGKGYKNNRLPIITWKHPISKVLLLRSSSLSSHQLIKMFKTGKYMPTTLKNASKNVKVHANQLLNNLQINNLPTLSDTRRYFMNLSQTVRQERNKFCDNYTFPQPFSQNVVTVITKEMRMLINRAHEGENTSQISSNIPDAKKYMRHSPIPNPQQNLQNINSDTSYKNQDLPDICFIGEKQNFKMFATMFKDCTNFQFIPFTYDGVDDVRKSYKKLFSLVTNADYLMDTCESLDKEQGSPIHAAKNPILSVKSPDFSDLSTKSSPLLETNNVLIGKNDTISPSDKPLNNTNSEKLQIKSLGYLSMLEKCGWLQQIYNVLRISSIIVEIMDSFNSSVIVGLENGCDITIQIVSIVQLLLDPYYRTIDGFKTLIYKEWFCHGHKFGERNRYGNNNNMMIVSQIKSTLATKTNSLNSVNNIAALNEKSLGNSEFQNDINLRTITGTMNENDGDNVKTNSEATSCYIPIFIQFLDMVYQIHRKFPSYFEFNGFFLEYLAFHSISGRYMDFFFNCHAERNIFEDALKNFGRDNPDSKLSTTNPVTIWESIEEIQKNKRFTFHNPLYEKMVTNEISLPPLRIFCTSLADLCVWPYYLRMSHTLYDGNCFGAYDQNFCHESTSDYNGLTPITEPEKNVVMHYNARCMKSNSFPLYGSHELSYFHLVENYDQKSIHNVAETTMLTKFMGQNGVDIKDSHEYGKRIMIALVWDLMRGNLKYPVGGKIMDYMRNLDQKFHQNILEHTITTLSSNHNFQKFNCSFTHAFNCDFCTHVITREHIVYTCSKCNYLCHDECLHYVIKSQCLKLNRENLANGNPSKGLIIKKDDKPISDEKIWLKKTDSSLYDENKSKPKIWNTQNNDMDITKSFDDFNDVLLQHFEQESHNKVLSTVNVSNDYSQNFNENNQFKKMDKFVNPNSSQRNLAYNFENLNNNNNNNNIYDERDITSDSQNILTKKHNTSLISIYENISKNDKKITYCNLTNTNPKRSQQNINKLSINEKPDKSDSSSINTSGISTLSTQTGIPSIPNDNFSSTYVSSLANGKNISNKNGLKLTLGKDLTLCEKSVQQSIYYQGFLYKKSGSLIKEWKPRWVVLDAVRHELRYYENENDQICRGVIELSHPYSVFPCANAPLTSEKLDENQPHQYFEIHVEKRTYIFAAFDSHSAKEWISRLRHLSTIH